MTRVVISQPMYFPWAGFMAQMALADIFIWLDDAQFSKGSFTSRVQVKTPNGCKWMSIPLVGQGSFQLIKNLEASQTDWLPNHRQLLRQSLIKQPHVQVALDLFDRVMAGCENLCDLLISGGEAQASHMGISPPSILRSSQMNIGGSSSERVLKLVKAVNGTEYVTGHGARNYLDHDMFNRNGISVSYMRYDLLPWQQAYEDFTPFVTGLDLIASQTPEYTKTHLRPISVDWRDFVAP